MYIFAEPVTEEQVREIQSQKDAEIRAFERDILGLTRGSESDTDDVPEIDPKWEEIHSNVQKAIEEDELFEDGLGGNEGIEGTKSNSKRPEVCEEGPLYARKSASGAGNGANAVSAGYEEEEEHEENKDDGDGNGNGNGNGDVEEIRRQEGPDKFLNDEAEINATDAFEAEHNIDGAGTEQTNVALSEDYPVKTQSIPNVITEERNEDDTPSAISRQQGSNAEASSIAGGEGQQEQQSRTGQALPGSINEEVVQENSAATSSGSKDLLAMTLTLRNKVNGKYVHRPERMSAADEWSVEYCLNEISEEKKARYLYRACQSRRRKKFEDGLVSNEEVLPKFLQNLRSLSRKGRSWRKAQDKMDEERPVQVLSEKEGQGAADKKEVER